MTQPSLPVKVDSAEGVRVRAIFAGIAVVEEVRVSASCFDISPLSVTVSVTVIVEFAMVCIFVDCGIMFVTVH